MSDVEKPAAVVSATGEVLLPEANRQRRKRRAGTRLFIEETSDGVLHRQAPLFAPTRPEDVSGSLRYAGPAKTLEEMDAGIVAEARRRHARQLRKQTSE